MDYIQKTTELIAEGETYTFKTNSYTSDHGTYCKAGVKM